MVAYMKTSSAPWHKKTEIRDRNYLIGRQPILNSKEEVVAYELLFRSTVSSSTTSVFDASQATASVIMNTMSGFGIDTILGKHRGFINVEIDLLMSDIIQILPKERVVLELLESLQVTPELVHAYRWRERIL